MLGVVVILRVCVGCDVGDRVLVPEGATVSVPDTLDVVLGVVVMVPVPVRLGVTRGVGVPDSVPNPVAEGVAKLDGVPEIVTDPDGEVVSAEVGVGEGVMRLDGVFDGVTRGVPDTDAVPVWVTVGV